MGGGVRVGLAIRLRLVTRCRRAGRPSSHPVWRLRSVFMDMKDAAAQLTDALGAEVLEVVGTFETWREHKTSGGMKQVNIKILRSATSGYMVTAEDEDGRHASGNFNEDLQAAIAIAHWYELDS